MGVLIEPRSSKNRNVLIATMVILGIFVLVIPAAYEEWGFRPAQGPTSTFTLTPTSSIPNTPISGTYQSTGSNTYLSCTISAGGFEFRVVSDSNGAPVNGETIRAVDRLGCNGQDQVVYLDSFSPPVYVTNFTENNQGWLVPDFPSQATWGGGLNFTITYQGATYNLSAYIPPVGTNCVTLHVPSGNVNSSTVMNGSGSYC